MIDWIFKVNLFFFSVFKILPCLTLEDNLACMDISMQTWGASLEYNLVGMC